jgi:hypothetical protein
MKGIKTWSATAKSHVIQSSRAICGSAATHGGLICGTSLLSTTTESEPNCCSFKNEGTHPPMVSQWKMKLPR